eukprot:4339839-Amphidinium_carterae.1
MQQCMTSRICIELVGVCSAAFGQAATAPLYKHTFKSVITRLLTSVIRFARCNSDTICAQGASNAVNVEWLTRNLIMVVSNSETTC